MPSKNVYVEVEYDVDLGEVLEFIEWAKPSELKEIRAALRSTSKQESSDIGDRVVVSENDSIMDQLATKELNEFLQRYGAEEAVKYISIGINKSKP